MKLWFVIFGILATHLIEARPNSEDDDVATNNGDSVARKSDAIKSRVKRQAINEDLMDYFPMEDMDEMDGPDVNVDVNVNIKSGGVADVGINVNVESGGDDGEGSISPEESEMTEGPTTPAEVTMDETSISSTSSSSRLYCEECGIASISYPRIVGGQESSISEYPWQVILEIDSSAFVSLGYCGASIIKAGWLLSAAHCFVDQSTFILHPDLNVLATIAEHNLVSDSESQSVDVTLKNVFIHPGYKTGPNPSSTEENDLALLYLGVSLTFGPSMKPICMPTHEDYVAESDVIVAGWGATSFNGQEANILQEVGLKLKSQDDCKMLNENAPQPFTVTDNMICAMASGKDACQGDSGGPLITQASDGRWVQLGIVSFGYECATPNVPGFYTNLANYVDWITNTTKSSEC